MTDNSMQAVIHDRIDPVLEAMIQGLVEARTRPGTQQQPADTVTVALTQGLLASLAPSVQQPSMPTGAVSQVPPLVDALASALATTLAPTLATMLASTLAPALASTLAPAIVSSLTTPPSQEQKNGQGEGQQEGQGSNHHQ